MEEKYEPCAICEEYIEGIICDKYECPVAKMKAEVERLEQDGLTEAHYKALYGAVYALADMVFQFGYSTTFRNKDAVCDGGLSALENAFGALLNCGCRTNSNGTISIKNLLEFQSEFEAKMVGESK